MICRAIPTLAKRKMLLHISTTAIFYLLCKFCQASQLTNAVGNISKDYFSGDAIIIRTSTFEPAKRILTDSNYLEEDITKNLMENSNSTFQVISDQARSIPVEVMKKNADCAAIIVIFETVLNDLTQLFNVIQSRRIIGPGTKILVVMMQKFPLEIIDQIFESFWRHLRAINTVILAPSGDKIDFFTKNPYKNPTQLEVINEWDYYFKSAQNIFPRKVPVNFSGFKMIAAVSAQPIFIFERSSTETYKEGIEIKMIETIAENLGLTVEYVNSPINENPRVTVSWGKFRGIFGLLYRQEADIGSAGVTIFLSRAAASTPLPPHTLEEMAWCVPRIERTTNWESLYGAYSPQVWLLFGTSLVSIILVLYFEEWVKHFKKYERGAKPAQMGEQTFLNTCLFVTATSMDNQLPRAKKQTFRLFWGVVLLFFMTTGTMYRSGVVTLLTAPHPARQIRTLTEAYDAGLVFSFIHAARTMLNSTNHEFWNQVLQPGRHFISDNATLLIQNVVFKKTHTVLGSLLLCDYYGNVYATENGDPLILTMPERFYLAPIYMFMSPGNPLTPLFSDKTQRLIESGFPEFWKKDIMYRTKIKRSGHKIVSSPSSSPKVLTVEQLRAVFFLLLFCLLGSFVVWVFELLQKIC